MGLTGTDEASSRKEAGTRDGSLDRVRELQQAGGSDRQGAVRDGLLDQTRKGSPSNVEPNPVGPLRSGSLDDARELAETKQEDATVQGADSSLETKRDGALDRTRTA